MKQGKQWGILEGWRLVSLDLETFEMGYEEEASERLRGKTESEAVVDRRQIRGLGVEGGRQEERVDSCGEGWYLGCPQAPRPGRTGLLPGKNWVSGLPRHCPNWLG